MTLFLICATFISVIDIVLCSDFFGRTVGPIVTYNLYFHSSLSTIFLLLGYHFISIKSNICQSVLTISSAWHRSHKPSSVHILPMEGIAQIAMKIKYNPGLLISFILTSHMITVAKEGIPQVVETFVNCESELERCDDEMANRQQTTAEFSWKSAHVVVLRSRFLKCLELQTRQICESVGKNLPPQSPFP